MRYGLPKVSKGANRCSKRSSRGIESCAGESPNTESRGAGDCGADRYGVGYQGGGAGGESHAGKSHATESHSAKPQCRAAAGRGGTGSARGADRTVRPAARRH